MLYTTEYEWQVINIQNDFMRHLQPSYEYEKGRFTAGKDAGKQIIALGVQWVTTASFI